MDFSGDLDEIAPTDDHKQNFQRFVNRKTCSVFHFPHHPSNSMYREIMKTLLNRYKTTLGLSQDQIAKIEVDIKGVKYCASLV